MCCVSWGGAYFKQRELSVPRPGGGSLPNCLRKGWRLHGSGADQAWLVGCGENFSFLFCFFF